MAATETGSVDVEFVNAFIEHQGQALQRAQTDLLVARTQETILRRRVESLVGEARAAEELRERCRELEGVVADLRDDVDVLSAARDHLARENGDLVTAVSALRAELEERGRVEADLSTARAELDALRRTVDDLFNRNANLDARLAEARTEVERLRSGGTISDEE